MVLFISFIVFGLIIILILAIGIAVERLVNCLFDCLKNKWFVLDKEMFGGFLAKLKFKIGATLGAT